MEIIRLPHLPEHPLRVCLFKDVKNASFLRTQLLEGNFEFEYAFLDASTLISRNHALAACFRTINDQLNNRLKSRNVHSEIVFSLSPNNNVSSKRLIWNHDSFPLFFGILGLSKSSFPDNMVDSRIIPPLRYSRQHNQHPGYQSRRRFRGNTIPPVAARRRHTRGVLRRNDRRNVRCSKGEEDLQSRSSRWFREGAEGSRSLRARRNGVERLITRTAG